jgi:hypothetical protein
VSEGSYEDGVAEGLKLAHDAAVRTEARAKSNLAAYRWMIRDCVAEVKTIQAALPVDIRPKLIGVISLLEKLAHAEVSQ